MSAHELKGLQVRVSKLDADIKLLESEQKQLQRNIALKKNEANSLKQKIFSLTEKEPIVTEHALLRYLERAMGIDMEKIQKLILSEENIRMIKFCGSGKIKVNGIELVVKDKVVVSVL